MGGDKIMDVTISAETKRKVINRIECEADTLRTIPFNYKADRNKRLIKSIELSLNENTLSDSITLEAAQEMKPNDVIIGTLLDYDYKMKVDRTSQQDIICKCNSMYFMDDLLNRGSIVPNIALDEPACYFIARTMARMIGLTPVMMFDAFYKKNSFAGVVTYYNDILSQAFGWSTSMPWRQINIFIRGDKLYFLQRGKEEKIIDISELHTSRPTIEREVYKTKYILNSYGRSSDKRNRGFTVHWPENNPNDNPDDVDAPQISTPTVKYFSGTLTCGNTTVVYSEGLMVAKTVHAPDDNGVVTYDGEMKYDGKRRLVYKKEKAGDGSYTVTTIAWGSEDNGSNTTTETQYEDGQVITKRVTVNEDLGNGFVGTSTYVDGEYQGSSISGSGTSVPNNYTTEKFNDAMNRGKENKNDDSSPVDISTGDKGDIPTGDDDILAQYANEIWSYDRKIKETVTLEIYEPVVNGVCSYNHVIDFTERIKWQGNEYYLKSNRVYLTPTELSQTVTMMRWY